MKINTRKENVIKLLQERQFVTTDELIEYLKLSKATIRRLLISMEEECIIRRFHGGVLLCTNFSSHSNIPLIPNENELAKQKIAEYTAKHFIKNQQTIFIGSGTTLGFLGNYLTSHVELTIFTNNLLLLPALFKLANIQLILTGGIVDFKGSTTMGSLYPHNFLTKNIAIDTVFLTGDCVSNQGCSQFKSAELYCEKAFLETSATKIILADHSKIGCTRPFISVGLDQIDKIITDQETEKTEELSKLIPIYYAENKIIKKTLTSL